MQVQTTIKKMDEPAKIKGFGPVTDQAIEELVINEVAPIVFKEATICGYDGIIEATSLGLDIDAIEMKHTICRADPPSDKYENGRILLNPAGIVAAAIQDKTVEQFEKDPAWNLGVRMKTHIKKLTRAYTHLVVDFCKTIIPWRENLDLIAPIKMELDRPTFYTWADIPGDYCRRKETQMEKQYELPAIGLRFVKRVKVETARFRRTRPK